MDELPEVRLIRADGRPTHGATKFGGMATFVCGEFKEECCGQRMVLLGQFDELDFPDAILPDRMVVYVFICLKCYVIWSACSTPTFNPATTRHCDRDEREEMGLVRATASSSTQAQRVCQGVRKRMFAAPCGIRS